MPPVLGIMPHPFRNVVVTPLLQALFPLCRKPLSTALVLATSLCAGSIVLAQPAILQDAANMDWVSWDQLSPAQKAKIPEGCCGLYVEPPVPTAAGNPDDVNVNSNTVDTSPDGKTEANGKLTFRQGALRGSADHGNYDENQQLLTLDSNILLRQNGMLLTGQTATVNGATKTSQLTKASYLLHATMVRGNAGLISYQDQNSVITIDHGSFTRCEPGDNAWLIKGDHIVLDREQGMGTARDVTLTIKNVPVMYLPWVTFPIDDRRTSGFLSPVFGSTQRGGFDVAVPYYFNLAPNYDLTLKTRWQSERGVMLGAETRYLGTNFGQELSFDYLGGDQRYDPASVFLPGTNSPPKPDRWSTDYKLGATLGAGWSANVNYRAVSDQDYFRDFGNDGLNSTSQSYLNRSASINYRDRHWAFTAATENVQLLDPTVSAIHEPYSTLPRLTLNGFYWLPSGLQYGISSELAVFDRNFNRDSFSAADIASGILVTGSRLALTPELSLPLTTAGAFFTPTLKYKYAAWSLSDQAAGQTASLSRGIASVSVDSGLIFERDLSLGGQSYRQTLEPRLYYLYNQYKNQNDIPLFDTSALTFSFNQLFRDDRFSGKDRVGDANQMTYALTSRLYNDKGQEKAELSVGRIQYFADRLVVLQGLPGLAETLSQSDITGEMSYQLAEHWRTSSYVEWNTATHTADVANAQLQYQQDANHILNLAWRYREMPAPRFVNGFDRRIKQSDISAVWPIAANWNLVGRWNYDYSNRRTLESIGGVEYSNCCWRVRLVTRSWIDNHALFFGHADKNSGIFVQFELKGLGSILGGNVRSILNNGISGFQDRNNGIN
jgi:LPS-assembly protein